MNSSARRLVQVGFTLVEVMVSMAIGLLIVLALITLLINVNRNNSEMAQTNRVIENGRFALQLLQADVSHAGYWMGFVPHFDDLTITAIPGDVPTAVPDPCLAYNSTNWTQAHKMNLVGIAVQGYEIPATVPSPTVPVCASRVVSPKARTDVLVVRHAETCVPGETGCAAVATGELQFQVDRCTAAPATDPWASPATTPWVLSDAAADLTKKAMGSDCTTATASEKRRFVSNLYYVRDYAVTAGDGIPTLMRSEFGLSGGTLQHKEAQPMIEGVEGFRVEFGIDNVSDSGAAVNLGSAIAWADPATRVSPTNRGDGIPDGDYIRCGTTGCTAAQLTNAVAVKLYVLVRSEKPTAGYRNEKTYTLGSTTLGPFNDSYQRHLFTQTVRLTNISTRRETPP